MPPGADSEAPLPIAPQGSSCVHPAFSHPPLSIISERRGPPSSLPTSPLRTLSVRQAGTWVESGLRPSGRLQTGTAPPQCVGPEGQWANLVFVSVAHPRVPSEVFPPCPTPWPLAVSPPLMSSPPLPSAAPPRLPLEISWAYTWPLVGKRCPKSREVSQKRSARRPQPRSRSCDQTPLSLEKGVCVFSGSPSNTPSCGPGTVTPKLLLHTQISHHGHFLRSWWSPMRSQ